MQGPASLERLGLPDAPAFTHGMGEVDGVEVMVCRTGLHRREGRRAALPGEDGAELWDAVVARGVTPCGLGARDTLRLEVCYPLHGNDITPETDAISAGLGWTCALDKEFTGVEVLRRVKEAGPERRLVAFVMEERAIPRQGMPIDGGGEVTSGTHSPSLDVGIGMGYVPAAQAAPDTELVVDVRGKPRRARVVKKPIYEKESLVAAAESYPDDLRYHPEHDWARVDGDEAVLGITWYAQDALGELVHFEAPAGRRDVDEGRGLCRGRVGEGGLGRDRAALRRDARGEPEGDRRARDDQRRPVRRRAGSSGSGSRTPARSTRCSTPTPTRHTSPSSERPPATSR